MTKRTIYTCPQSSYLLVLVTTPTSALMRTELLNLRKPLNSTKKMNRENADEESCNI
jgi:hypothetical protein